AATDDDGELDHPVLVDQPGPVQRLHQLPRAVHLQLLPRPLLERANGGDDVVADERDGVVPRRVGEGGRYDVLGPGVEGGGDDVVGVGDLWPVGSHDVVGPAAVEQLGGAGEPVGDDAAEVLVDVGDGPASAVEAAG